MIAIKKGLDLPLAGKPEQQIYSAGDVSEVAVLGEDYIGMRPTMLVKVGDYVKKGTPLFVDKKNPGIHYVAPLAGTVSKINRGKERVLQSVVIQVGGDDELKFNQYSKDQLDRLTVAQIEENLVRSGLWTSIRSRPFSKVARLDAQPSSIFVNAMDTNPLAANPAIIITARLEEFKAGLVVLTRLRNTKIHLCKAVDFDFSFEECDAVAIHQFKGVHPAGLVGTHIHFIDPVSINKQVWYLNYQDVIAIGALFLTGKLDVQRVIALAGPQVKQPRLLRTVLGANLYQLTENELAAGENRIISGSALNGVQVDEAHAYLGRYHLQVTVILEGFAKEFMGWINLGPKNYTITRITIGHFLFWKLFKMTSTLNGGYRAMVPIGTYERVMPLDILPTLLLRNLIIGDTDEAQDLGCLELDEEDLALCTYVCPGKYDYGTLLRQVLTKIEMEG